MFDIFLKDSNLVDECYGAFWRTEKNMALHSWLCKPQEIYYADKTSDRSTSSPVELASPCLS